MKRQKYGTLLPFLAGITPNGLWQYTIRNIECTNPMVQLHKLLYVMSHPNMPVLEGSKREEKILFRASHRLLEPFGNRNAKRMLDTSEPTVTLTL